MHLLLKYGDTSWISFSKRGFLPPPTFKLMKLELDEKSSLYVYVCVHFFCFWKIVQKVLEDLFLAALKIEMQR